MNIQIQYQPSAQELTKASLLFVEKKPLMLFCIGCINLIALFFLGIMILKLLLQGLVRNEWIVTTALCLWLFGRRPFNQWLLSRRMKPPILNNPLSISLSLNGIAWTGKGIRPGSMGWDQVKYILEAQNGFILPYGFNKFLWIPARGFPSREKIAEFKQLIKEKKIVHRVFSRWLIN